MSAWPKRPWPEAVPRFVTPRNFDRPTLGPEMAEVSRQLGFEPMPWNLEHWDTLYEYTPVETPNGTINKLWYREGVLTVPRQSSKTTGTLVRHAHRCTKAHDNGWLRPGERSNTAFTMQHRNDAAKKMKEGWFPILDPVVNPNEWNIANIERCNRGAGTEQIKWLNGALTGVFPPNITGAHGDTLDAVDVDEAWSFPDDRAEQGARPAMITRLSPQIVIQSTQGTMDSTYFNDKCNDGRDRAALAHEGKESHIYYLEYSCGPADDIDNPDHWPRWMPALGYTIDIDAIMAEWEASRKRPDYFLRAYGNVRVGRNNQIIPASSWANCYRPKSYREGKVWMAVDASPGIEGAGRSGSISIASYRGDDIAVEVIRHGPGVMWIPEAIGELTRQHKCQMLWLDPIGPIGSIQNDIKLKSMARIEVIDARGMVNACGRFHQAVLDGTVHHRGQDMLNGAVEGAAKRTLEDGWAWKRATSSSDISPLVACTLAHWAAALDKDRGLIGMHTPGAK